MAGGAGGVDTLAVRWAKQHNMKNEVYWARWDKEGKVAGFNRNNRMLNEGRADALVAIWNGKSRGTKNMIESAEAKGIKVCVVTVAI